MECQLLLHGFILILFPLHAIPLHITAFSGLILKMLEATIQPELSYETAVVVNNLERYGQNLGSINLAPVL